MILRRLINGWRARLRATVRRWLGLKPKPPKTDRRLRIVINGKAAERPDIQLAVQELRQAGLRIDLAITRREADAARLAAVSTKLCDVVVAAGGDGTVQEVAEGLLRVRTTRRPALAVLPAGTANDFATACQISNFPLDALHLAASGRSRAIDLMRVVGLDPRPGDQPAAADWSLAVNVITAAFVADDAAEVSDELKRLIGGPAYWVAGLLRTLQLRPRRIVWRAGDQAGADDLVVLTLANGRQTGGGSIVAPQALIDDGLMDVRMIRAFDIADFATVVREVGDPDIEDPRFVIRLRTSAITLASDTPWSMTLDGEPRTAMSIEVSMMHDALRMVVPSGAPLRPRSSRPHI